MLTPYTPLGTELRVSNSEIGTFMRCPRKWLLQYYFGLQKPERELEATGSAMLGIRLHAALQGMYGHGLDPIDILRKIYGQAVMKWPDQVDEIAKEADMAYAILHGYLDWLAETGADADLRPVAAEQVMTVPAGQIEGIDVIFQARLDVMMQRISDGKYLFMDHKSGSGFEKGEVLDIDDQMAFYVLLQRLAGQQADGGIYNMLKRSKRTARATPPFYMRYPVIYNAEETESAWYRAMHAVAGIISTRRQLDDVFLSQGPEEQRTRAERWIVPRKSAVDCSWSCPFVRQCPMLDDGSRWENALESAFVKTDPYEYHGHSLLNEAISG